jgi:hypothetical protein
MTTATDRPVDEGRRYVAELDADEDLRRHLEQAITGDRLADRPAYGRRAGWYALVRILRPTLVVESGIDKGLGTCVLAAAVERNVAEGHAGRVVGLDINPAAGAFVTGRYAPFVDLMYRDSLESIRHLDSIAMFLHDSNHSREHEVAEFQALSGRLADGAVVLSDNSHLTDALPAFAEETGRRFLFFAEEPDDHWYPGGGIGLALPH